MQFLDDPGSATDTRRDLSEGLKADNGDVVWGCARCLWQAGARTDPGLAAGIVRTGLSNPSWASLAKAWLAELLSQPRTVRKTLSAINEVASEVASRYRRGYIDYEHAWQVASCLLSLGKIDSQEVARALLVGGFADRARHNSVIETVKTVISDQGSLADRVEEELWSAVGRSYAGKPSCKRRCRLLGGGKTFDGSLPIFDSTYIVG